MWYYQVGNWPDNIRWKKNPILSGKKTPDIIRKKNNPIMAENNPIPITEFQLLMKSLRGWFVQKRAMRPARGPPWRPWWTMTAMVGPWPVSSLFFEQTTPLHFSWGAENWPVVFSDINNGGGYFLLIYRACITVVIRWFVKRGAMRPAHETT